MTRESWLSVLGLFGVALVARAVFAGQVVFPKPEDTAYYVGVARNLLEGRGLVSDALWSYATPPLVFPRPAFEVWLPLPTFLAAIPMLAFGPTFQAAQISSVLIGAAVPVLAWRLAADVAAERGMPPVRARTLALGTGLTSAVYLPLVLHSALPDSTMTFAAVALGACLLMTRVLRDPRDGRIGDPRLLAIGALLGLAALTRNEAAWLALTWVLLVLAARGIGRPLKVRLIAIVAVVALVVFAPWALRNWLVFGSPLPGQAVTNAFSISGFDIFAWKDPPTLSRYLAVGPARLLEMRIEGLGHNFGNVLLLPGFPLSAIGLLALPWTARGRAVRPVVLVGLITFLVTSLVFPVATTWGTFLHAAGPVHVLIVLSALLALDAGLVALGRRLGWAKEVGWLGATMGVASSLLFSVVLLAGFGSGSRDTARLYEELGTRMAAVDRPLGAPGIRLMSNFPIWVAETQRASTLALPDEPPSDVLDLAGAFPGTRYLILTSPEGEHWPGDLAAGRPGSDCFVPVALGPPTGDGEDPLSETSVYEIACPGERAVTDPYTPKPMDAAAIEALDAERARIGREIHDGPAQALTNAIFEVDDIERLVERDPAGAMVGLRSLRALLRRELANVREFISELRPATVDAAGLDVALGDAVDGLRSATRLGITTDLRAPSDRLDDRQRTVVLRVAQEALQNVRKHANASTVMVSTDVTGDGWTLEIRDDGRGFDMGTVAKRGRRNFGMQVMNERAELIGARFDVRSRPDGGTVVRLAIPTGDLTGAKENG